MIRAPKVLTQLLRTNPGSYVARGGASGYYFIPHAMPRKRVARSAMMVLVDDDTLIHVPGDTTAGDAWILK